MDYIQRMIDIRIDNDDTQTSLCKKLDINRVQWTNYERRKNEMPIRYLIAFCNHYEVSADYILGLPRDRKWPR